MKTDMYEANTNSNRDPRLAGELDKECETWDWARAAGVSAQDLRVAVVETLSLADAA
jgi:hypothetical protein